ncbi:MAG TPA: alcohol dehydrogenase catalytic domain-containing protein [Rhodanobacteraceae bacterium]
MKAICVNADRHLQVRDIPAPDAPPPGHVVVDIDACGINHGDKVFLARPGAAGGQLGGSNRVWGASAAGTVRAVGADVDAGIIGKKVAIYRSLSDSAQTIGLWCERAQVLFSSCVVLPDEASTRDYCASLVNVITPYAFVQDVVAAGQRGIIATAGASATALALAVLAQRQGVAVIHLVRSDAERTRLRDLGIEHVLSTSDADFDTSLGTLAERLATTAVFDGLGGALLQRLAPQLPMDTTIYVYGLLDATAPISITAQWLMSKNLVVRRFSNFNSVTVKDPARRQAALADLRAVIGHPWLQTRIGQTFPFDAIDEALAYAGQDGTRAVLIPPAAQS